MHKVQHSKGTKEVQKMFLKVKLQSELSFHIDDLAARCGRLTRELETGWWMINYSNWREMRHGRGSERTDARNPVFYGLEACVQGHAGVYVSRYISVSETRSGSWALPGPTGGLRPHTMSMGTHSSLPKNIYQFVFFTFYKGSFIFPRSIQRGGIHPL